MSCSMTMYCSYWRSYRIKLNDSSKNCFCKGPLLCDVFGEVVKVVGCVRPKCEFHEFES